jgi:hypothetical protein
MFSTTVTASGGEDKLASAKFANWLLFQQSDAALLQASPVPLAPTTRHSQR